MTRLAAVALLALSFVLPGCDSDVPDGVDSAAQAAWVEWKANPGPASILRLLDANRKAALRHRNPDDALGVLYQVRGTEAVAARAESESDLEVADETELRLTDLEEGGILEAYEEVLPGSQARFLSVRDRMRTLLGRD